MESHALPLTATVNTPLRKPSRSACPSEAVWTTAAVDRPLADTAKSVALVYRFSQGLPSSMTPYSMPVCMGTAMAPPGLNMVPQ